MVLILLNLSKTNKHVYVFYLYHIFNLMEIKVTLFFPTTNVLGTKAGSKEL